MLPSAIRSQSRIVLRTRQMRVAIPLSLRQQRSSMSCGVVIVDLVGVAMCSLSVPAWKSQFAATSILAVQIRIGQCSASDSVLRYAGNADFGAAPLVLSPEVQMTTDRVRGTGSETTHVAERVRKLTATGVPRMSGRDRDYYAVSVVVVVTYESIRQWRPIRQAIAPTQNNGVIADIPSDPATADPATQKLWFRASLVWLSGRSSRRNGESANV
jgi:hypothetical protein